MSNATNLRFLILDYAYKQLDNINANRALSDLIIMKQKNFLRTDPNYVVLDKHDMIGTHFLIYETSSIFQPKLIFALRTTYEDRCHQHRIKTPFQELLPHLDKKIQNAYEQFHHKFPTIVDCNSWCVDLDFSMKKSGLNLSDIGYTMVYLHLYRMGLHHILGCTNEKYKASRWLENVGTFEKGFEFIHPVVPDPHLAILIENFNREHLSNVFHQYRTQFENLIEITYQTKSYAPTSEIFANAFNDSLVRNKERAA